MTNVPVDANDSDIICLTALLGETKKVWETNAIMKFQINTQMGNGWSYKSLRLVKIFPRKNFIIL